MSVIDPDRVKRLVDYQVFDEHDMMRWTKAVDDEGNPVTRFYTWPPMLDVGGAPIMAFADITPAEMEHDDIADVCIKVCNRMVETGDKIRDLSKWPKVDGVES
jgi:hypothetical protein